jgi:hypothetical protein
MKWLVLLLWLALAAVPAKVLAQEVVPIGNIPHIDARDAIVWGMSGMEIIDIKTSDGSETPGTRMLTWDARTVEILSRTEAPPLRASDFHVESKGDKALILVRRFLLLEVTPEDARAAHTSVSALANKWAARVRYVFPQVAPFPNRFGV